MKAVRHKFRSAETPWHHSFVRKAQQGTQTFLGWDGMHSTTRSSAVTEVGSQSNAGTSVSAIPQPMLGASSARMSPGIPTSAHILLGSEQHNQKYHPNFLVSFSLLYQLNYSSVLGVPQRCITSSDELGLEGLYIRPIWLSGYYQLKTWCFPLSTLKCVLILHILCLHCALEERAWSFFPHPGPLCQH